MMIIFLFFIKKFSTQHSQTFATPEACERYTFYGHNLKQRNWLIGHSLTQRNRLTAKPTITKLPLIYTGLLLLAFHVRWSRIVLPNVTRAGVTKAV
jgi:hypothetical protein